MCESNFISGMVMYTIKNEDLRNAVRDGIISEFGDKPLDQSSYEIPCAGELRGGAVTSLKNICKNAEEGSNTKFCDDDFVTFYRATDSIDEQRDKIKRIKII